MIRQNTDSVGQGGTQKDMGDRQLNPLLSRLCLYHSRSTPESSTHHRQHKISGPEDFPQHIVSSCYR